MGVERSETTFTITIDEPAPVAHTHEQPDLLYPIPRSSTWSTKETHAPSFKTFPTIISKIQDSYLEHVDKVSDIIRWFMPSWFTVTMGTGILSQSISRIPYNLYAITILGQVLFFVNLFLLFVLTVVQLIQFIFYPGIFQFMRKDPRRMLHYGAIPMAISTVVNGALGYGYHESSAVILYICWGGWWASCIFSIVCAVLLQYLIISQEIHGLESLTGAWLLLVAPLTVSATTAGTIADVLPSVSTSHAFTTIAAGYCLWGTGALLIFCIIVLYFHRLTVYKLPSLDAITTAFVPLGPVGQVGTAALVLGKAASTTLPEVIPHIPNIGVTFGNFGILVALASWGCSFFWAIHAVFSLVYRRSIGQLPFNLGWWSFTFPIGVFAILTASLADELDLVSFRVFFIVLLLVLLLNWILVVVRTLVNMWTGKIFETPCMTSDRNVTQIE